MARRLDLRGALAKLEWAQQHVGLLKRDVFGWMNRDGHPPVSFQRKYNSDSGVVSFWVESVSPPRQAWSLMIGDALNNYRAAIDHLAWQLVQAGNKPTPKTPTRVQFPICRINRKTFIRMCQKDRLPGVSLRRVLMLSPFQPYKGRELDGERAALDLLGTLTNTDKHREMLVTFLRPYGYTIHAPPGSTTEAYLPPGAGREQFSPGTEVVRVVVRPWTEPEPDVRVEFNAARHIAFENRAWVFPLLLAVDVVVKRILGKFL